MEWMLQLKLEQQMMIMIDGFADLRHIMRVHVGLDMINQKRYVIQEIQQVIFGMVL